jgi:hypothetical protein
MQSTHDIFTQYNYKHQTRIVQSPVLLNKDNFMIPGKRFIFLIYFQYQTFYFTYQAKLMKYLSDIPNKTTTRNSYNRYLFNNKLLISSC